MKVQRWRKALYDAANFSGWDSSNVRLESELVDKIVEDVLQKLNHINPHIPKVLVGIRQISIVESLLCIGSADVRIIGIWGMGGIDGFGYSSDIGMRILEDNSLISVSKRHEVEMHDLIQDMGSEIVHQESPKEPGKRSRLWDPKEIYHVLKYNMGTDAIEGIVLDMSKIKDLQIRPQAFARMYRLRILKLYMRSYDKTCNVHISRCLESLPDELSYFRWDCFPLKMLPQSFCAEKLVQLDLRRTLVERLWDGVQDLANLTSLFLTGCMHLVELPDFSEASKLEEVHLDYCISLRHLPSSIFSSKYLFAINLRCCRQLQHIHSDMDSKSLQWLNLSGCSKLIEFSVASEKLEYLNLEGTAIEELSSSVGRLKNLSSLHLSGCRRLKLEILPPTFDAFLGSVKILCLDSCSKISKLPDNLGILSALNRLSLRGSNIETLPVSIKHLSQLRTLNISNCKRLESLPELPIFLQDFNASGSTSLETVSSSGVALLENSFGRSNKRSFLKQIKEEEEKSVCHRDYLAKYDFYNCRKLDQNAHKSIMAEAVIRIQHAAYLSSMIEARYDPYCEPKHDYENSGLENFEYTSRRVYICLPGSEVPKWFRYKATECSTITVMIPRDWFSECMHLGVAFCLVHARSQSNKMGNNNHGFVLGCKTYLNHSYDGTYIMKSSGSDVQSDHAWLWYDKLPIRTQDMDSYFTKVSFEFFVRGRNSRFIVKQCGVQPLYAPHDIDMAQSSNGKVGNKERERGYFESKLYDSKIGKLEGESVSYLSGELLWMEIQKSETDFGSGMSGKQSYLKLDGYLWKSLPLDFFAVEDIVEVLSLRDSKIESLPASIKHLSRLKYIYLDGCKRLQSIPELPPFIEYVDASNCISLETVSYSKCKLLKKYYRNKNRSITCLFVNCMKLDEYAMDSFFRHTHLILKQAACNYFLSITDQTEARPDFRRFDFCFPGSKVPDFFTYRTTQSVNIELTSLSGLLGFVFCVVISHVHLVGPRVVLECHMENGERIRTLQGPFLVTSMDSDHAYLWSDKSVSEEMLRTKSQKVFLRFACYMEPDGSTIKEYGVCPIYHSVPSRFK
ncbi:hypothetical protein L6164_001435 [Bauhinia variegata]|uniref:Uncharacterized protein n=1 Tax=Bauhinia variegata TaxID=167791 RepID=A0ACB9QAW4_BAUVA|nr:hypothetical protein L6164_001435 [Bauhinia variegata]